MGEEKPKKKKKDIPIGFIMSFVFIALVVLFGGRIKYLAPDNAVVFANFDSKVFSAPPCVTSDEEARLVEMTLNEAHGAGLLIDEECFNSGVLFQRGRVLLGFFMEKIGLLEPASSRWNEDGTWNW